jgi:phage terminase Nu1 subunit (DNA packaging protein)
MPTVDVTKVASALNLKVRRVQQLVGLGMPREGRGQYDAMRCLLWYVRYLQGVLEKRSASMPDGGHAGVREERVRLLRADADLKEMKLARERSQLISLVDYERALADLALTTKARVMAVGPRIAQELVGETSRTMIQAKLEKAFKEVLHSLACREGDDAEAGNPQIP